MMYLSGGKMAKVHLGMNSKLQWPKLFMRSINVMYPHNATSEPVPVIQGTTKPGAKIAKYSKCSANG